MKDQQSAAPQAARIEAGDTVMLYDPSQGGNFVAELRERAFDIDYWQTQQALRGAARGRGNTWFFNVGGRDHALRHYRRGGLIAKFSADRYLHLGLERARPVREFLLTQMLHAAGLPVPAVVAARVERRGVFYCGDLITQRLPDVATLAERLGKGDLTRECWHELGKMLARFHDFGLDHADLNAHNVLSDALGSWWLIDFDRGQRRQRGLWCDDNLVRLRRSILKISFNSGGVFGEHDWGALLAGYREHTTAVIG